MAKTTSGTKLVPPPKDFVPQGDYGFSHRGKMHTSDSSLMGNSSVDEDAHFLGEGNGAGALQGNGQHSSQNPLYKTELCRSFEEFGTCRYGNKCQFAHSLDELRPVQRHPKYKTEVCRTFATTGTCPYGTRCRFIHQSATLAQLRTAKAGASVPMVETMTQSTANVQRMESNGQHLSGIPIRMDSNPASFANVARGIGKSNRNVMGMMPKTNSAHQMNGSASSSFVQGMNLGVSPTSKLPDYATVAAKNSFRNSKDEKHLEYETALTAALDVLHCQDDPLYPETDTSSTSLMGKDVVLNGFGSFPGESQMNMLNMTDGNLMIGTGRPGGESPIAGGSLPASPHFMGDMGGQQTPLSSSLTSSMMSNAGGQRERRLPVFSNLHTDK